jgi:hypothetical protein
MWVAAAWLLLSVLGALLLGKAIRMADRHDLRQDRPGETRSDKVIPGFSSLRRPRDGVPRQRRG